MQRASLLNIAVDYGALLLAAYRFLCCSFCSKLFCGSRKAHLGLLVSGVAGVTNMVLDAVLVILLPQEYKLAGAAVATAFSQFLGGVIPLVYFLRKNTSILRLGKTNFDGRAIVKACTNGSSEFMSNISMNIVGMLNNIQLLHYAGENGVAAYGVMMYVSMIFSAAFIGYSIGSAPVISYHDGAKNTDELKGLLKKSLRLLASVGLLCCLPPSCWRCHWRNYSWATTSNW